MVKKNFANKRHHTVLFKHVDLLILLQPYQTIYDRSIYKMSDALNDRNITNYHKTMDNIIKSGVAPSRLVSIISLMNPLFFIANDTNVEMFVRFISHFDICHERLRQNGTNWMTSRSETGAEILSNGKMIVSYVSLRMVANKVRFEIKQDIAGFLISFIQADDYTGKCGIDADTFDDFKTVNGIKLTIPRINRTDYPFLRSIDAAINASLAEMQTIESNSTKEINKQNANGDALLATLNSFCFLIVFVSIFSSVSGFTSVLGIRSINFY